MPKVNLSKIVELAGKATPGKWHTRRPSAGLFKDGEPIIGVSHGYMNDVDYIASCSPENILALAESLKIAVGALNKSTSSTVSADDSGKNWEHVVAAKEALIRIAELVEV